MGSSTSKGKGGAMTGSKLPKIGMADSYSNNASKGNKGDMNTSNYGLKSSHKY